MASFPSSFSFSSSFVPTFIPFIPFPAPHKWQVVSTPISPSFSVRDDISYLKGYDCTSIFPSTFKSDTPVFNTQSVVDDVSAKKVCISTPIFHSQHPSSSPVPLLTAFEKYPGGFTCWSSNTCYEVLPDISPKNFPERFRTHASKKFCEAPTLSSPKPKILRGAGGAFKTFFEALSGTIHRDTLATPLVEAVSKPLRDSITAFPYQVPDKFRGFLNDSGITLSDFGVKSHPHPVHKTLELHLLNDVWTHYASAPSSVLFMKDSKFQELQRRNPNFEQLHNYRIVPKDTVRYPSTSNTLPDTENVFMHDALMYFSPAQILKFFIDAPEMQKLFCSLVVPPESDFTSVSFSPDLYKFSFENDNLKYVLENNPAHSYTQPRSALHWLKTSAIVGAGLELSVTILDSWGPVHSILIQRGLAPSTPLNDSVQFKVPSAVLLPSPNSLFQPIRDRLVPRSVYNALFAYTRAVRTLRVTDPAGFVRTQSNKPEFAWVTSAAWDNLQHFSLLTAPHRPISHYMLFRSPLQRLKHWCKTNEFYFFIGACFSSIPAFMFAGRVISELACSQVLHFSLLHRWIVRPPTTLRTLLFRPKAPWFSIAFEPKRVDLFGLRSLRPIVNCFPKLLSKFQPQKPGWKCLAFVCFLVGVPLTVATYRWFYGPDTPQNLHDNYARYFHTEDWVLKFERSVCYCSPESSVLPSPPSQASPVAAPITSWSISEPEVSPPSEEPPSSNSADIDISFDPPPPPAPEVSTQAVVDPAPPSAVRTAQIFFPRKIENLNQSPADEVAEPAPASEEIVHSVSNLGVVESSSGVPIPPPQPTPPQSPLEVDVSACGPMTTWQQAYPAAYRDFCGDFPYRRRSSPPSPLPAYPVGSDCGLVAFSKGTNIDVKALWTDLCAHCPDSLLDSELYRNGLTTSHLTILCYLHSCSIDIYSQGHVVQIGVKPPAHRFSFNHFPPTPSSRPHFEFRSSELNGANSPRPKNSIFGQAAKEFRLSDGSVLPFLFVHRYTTNVNRAKNLISNMKNGFDGIMANVDPLHPGSARAAFLTLDASVDMAAPRSVELVHIAGFAGCGKSFPIQNLLKNHPSFSSSFRVAVPTTELRSEWKSALGLGSFDAWRVSTWESALLKQARVLVIDEVYKLPRGYLDLAIHADPTIEIVFVLGDPIQGEYHSTHSSSSNYRLPSEVSHLSKYVDIYCLWSRRIPQNVAQFFKVPTLSSVPGVCESRRCLSHSSPILVCAQATAKTVENLGFKAVTMSSSQGATFDPPVEIVLDKHCKLLSNSNCLVALTRSRSGVRWVGDQSMLSFHGCLMFHQFANSKELDLFQVFPVLKQFRCISEPMRARRPFLVGSNSPSRPVLPNPSVSGVLSRYAKGRDPEYRSDVFLDQNQVYLGDGCLNARQVDTTFLPETGRPLHFDLPFASVSSPSFFDKSCSQAPLEPVYPGENFETLAAHFLAAHDPLVREVRYRDGSFSNQFPWVDAPFSLSCQPSSLISAIHSSKHDPGLLTSSIGKRLRFRASDSPYSLSPSDEILGSVLFSSWCRAYSRCPESSEPFDESLFAECISANEFSQLTSKTQKVIMSNADRSDPDWRWSAVRIFSKTQHKVNEGSIFGDWKACQTLALMHDAVILLLGPVKKYQRLFDSRDRPGHIYYHAGHTPSEMSSWCKSHLTESVHVANDYTSFDQSQHGEAVVFERLKMQRLNIPQHLIDLHVFLKTNVSTQFGLLTCMRLTGEPGTYDDNSDYNLAVLFCEYNITNQAVMVSGDDSLIDSRPPTRFDWDAISKLLHLRFKKEFSPYGLFCGYYVGPAGACRSPKALFAKLMISIDDGSIEDKIASYATEFAVGHCLGNCFWNLLPLDSVPFQSAVFDFFCRFAPPVIKSAFFIGELPESVLLSLFPQLRWISNVTASMLLLSSVSLLSSEPVAIYLLISVILRQRVYCYRIPIHLIFPLLTYPRSQISFLPSLQVIFLLAL
nr:polyprotein [Styphnolobium tymo-like virus]